MGPDTPGFVGFFRGARDRRAMTLAREQWADPARRALYLLRDVEQPISFDGYVVPFADEGEASTIELVAAVLAPGGAADEGTVLAMGEPLDALPVGAAGWTFLGFDVCDTAGYSGVMNCDYSKEREHLAATWHDRLNEHHLLVDLDAANEFRSMTDLRVPEHAPFLVHGLFCRGLVAP